MSDAGCTLMVFRRDLRLDDNAAFTAAVGNGRPLACVFILDDEDLGGASRWWLHHSLSALENQLRERGLFLAHSRGPLTEVLPALISDLDVREVHLSWSLQGNLEAGSLPSAVPVHTHHGHLLTHPSGPVTGQGGPYKVFTPYHKKFLDEVRVGSPQKAPRGALGVEVPGPGLDSLELLPTIDWAAGLRETWTPGEEGARDNLNAFKDKALPVYSIQRDFPAKSATSRLSAHLSWGEISPRRVWHACRQLPGAEGFLRQLVWREFAHHVLHHHPHTIDAPLRPEFRHFPWDGDPDLLEVWQHGRTGYPLVDAGMRELWHTGFMHNRVRMVTASFLVKHLLLPWHEGARFFHDTLVDADPANNTFGWQWTAGCGADAAPYFRVFNPTAQAKKFDRDERYIRRWVPELNTPDYPAPVVDHAWARQRALDSYQRMKAST